MTEKLPVSLTTWYYVYQYVVALNPQRSAAWMVERLREKKKSLFDYIRWRSKPTASSLYVFMDFY